MTRVDKRLLAEEPLYGPPASSNNTIPVFDGTTGKLVKDSGVSIADIGSGTVQTVAPGTGILVDNTNPANPSVSVGPSLAGIIPQTGPRGGLMSIVGGNNVYLGDNARDVVNQQELAAYYKGLRDSAINFNASGSAGTLVKTHIFVVGDSKVGYSDPTHTIIQNYADWIQMGQVLTFNIPSTGGGQNTYWLDNTAAPAILGSGAWPLCKLVIIDIGTNERAPGANGGAQTAAQTENNLMSFISKLRNTGAGGRSPDNLSIVIMGQTPGNTESPNFQNEVLMRELDTIYRRVAKNTNSVFVDQRGRFPRPHYDAGWMDDLYTLDPMYGHTSVHPLLTGSVIRQQVLLDVLFPEVAVMRWNVPVFQSLIYDNGWTTWSAGNGVRAFKIKNRVSWEGLARAGTLTAGTQIGHLAVTAGWAPLANKFFPTQRDGSSLGNFYVHATGTVNIQGTWITDGWVGFDSVTYRVGGPVLS